MPGRGILLKGNGLLELWPAMRPTFAFMPVAILVGLRLDRRPLD